jgi:hypothetical protein
MVLNNFNFNRRIARLDLPSFCKKETDRHKEAITNLSSLQRRYDSNVFLQYNKYTKALIR